jgi:drug/metabolite transporter (DMT)-like permease
MAGFLNAAILGLIALFFWATSVAFTRTLTETLGPIALVAVSFSGGGLILSVMELIRYRKIRALAPPSWKYLLFCGIFFLGYTLGYVPALALAKDRQVALQLGVVNYLWPGLIVLGSVFILKYRPRWIYLIPGIIIAFFGIFICMAGEISLDSFLKAMRENTLAFALMAGSAVCWALYSNCAHKYSPKNGASGVPLFQLATGLIFFILQMAGGAKAVWTTAIIGPLVYYMVFVTALGYLLWDFAMQKGKVVLLGIASYLLPLVSTLFAGWYFHEPVGWSLLAGAVLVMLGAVLSRWGIEKETC